MRRRPVQHIEFGGADRHDVLDAMRRLTAARDGWINFLPGVPDDAVDAPSPGVFGALFGSAQPPVSMCTWLPADGKGSGVQTVGVMHPRGRFALRQLASMGVALPAGWRVRQDHARRGIIVHPPANAAVEVVLDWLLLAGAALAMVPLTGTWQAQVYVPLASADPPDPERSTTS